MRYYQPHLTKKETVFRGATRHAHGHGCGKSQHENLNPGVKSQILIHYTILLSGNSPFVCGIVATALCIDFSCNK